MSSGEKQCWELLAKLNPDDVCKKAQALYDKAASFYTLESFGIDIHISPKEETIFSHAAGNQVLLQRLAYFSRLSILRYLTGAKDIPLSGELIKPVNLKGGQLFFRGTHVLPCDALAEKYGNNIEGFLAKGSELGGEQLKYGDASVRLFPLPKVPVVLILWRVDEEFPARLDLLFDSACEIQLPIDIIWSVAMMSLLIMM
ncbi:MAG: DUF3786 domain-containing protein [Nitrospirae bacterium]|nr:DUF3786 domain-containing protein [Nitrospirota bacterium]